MKATVTLLPLLLLVVAGPGTCQTPAQNSTPALSPSVLSTLLDTLAKATESEKCPGKCLNALAALICNEVVEGDLCPTGMKCCRARKPTGDSGSDDNPVTAPTTDTTDEPEEEMTTLTEGLNTWSGVLDPEEEDEVVSPTLQPSTEEPQREDSPVSTLVAKPAELIQEGGQGEEETVVEKLEEEKDPEAETNTNTEVPPITTTPKAQAYAPSSSLRVCPGVCVANRISEYCEAALDVNQLCRSGLRCCVSADLFADVDEPPKEFVLLNPKKSQEKTERPDSEDSSSTDRPTTTTATTTTQWTTVYTRRPEPRPNPLLNIPPELHCKGTCVAGFFAFLCDEIDRTGACPRGGRCCVTKRRRPRPNPNDNYPDTKPITTTSSTSTTSTTSSPSLPPCPGTCLPSLVSSFCNQPSVLLEVSSCEKGTVCCNNRAENETPLPPPREPPPSPPQERPIPPAFQTLASLFTRPSPPPRTVERPNRPPATPPPPPPPPPTTTMTSTTTTSTTSTTTTTTTPLPTTEAPDLRPECPGTCIQPFLSFTCFGNAEMTDLFKCSKLKTECCSPKSALRDVLRFEEIQNIARNDTVLHNPYDGSYAPGYGHTGYEQPPYEQPPYDPSNYHPYEQPTYEQPPYEQPAYEQPPYEQPYEQPSYEQPTYEQPSYEQPPYEQPPYEQPQYEQPSYEQPPYEQPPHKEAAYEKTSYEQPPYPPYQPEQPYQQPYQPQQNVTQVPPALVQTTTPAPVRNKYVCGVKGSQRHGRVVGGEDSVPGEWCWQVALINSLNQYLCGGALIGTQWVLTAAHCVTNIVRSGDAIYVRVGDHDLTTKFGSPGAQTLRVATTYIHHNHNSQTLDNDIALLKLHGHADLKEGVCLVCLPARGVSQVAGNRCIVTGYGYMGETGPIPLRVREAEVPVVSDNECVRKINAVTEKIFILPASSFCAGGESGHDACQGDGGGPLVCNVDGYFELSGLVSWGFGCGRKDVPGVYVKVSSFIGWINQIISVNNL
ncbi:protein masquerade [Panulirus ornatus]|uniref:protein masquerade n=1 Tax=Panulirus ornatus TaxID=150431 RepID=UPI003A83D7F9